jgi:hypothetical protein
MWRQNGTIDHVTSDVYECIEVSIFPSASHFLYTFMFLQYTEVSVVSHYMGTPIRLPFEGGVAPVANRIHSDADFTT